MDDGEAEALRRKLKGLQWRPENGFLKDQVIEKAPPVTGRSAQAA